LKAIGLTSVVLGCFREWAPETGLLKELVVRIDARVADKGDGAFVTAIVSTLGRDGVAEIAKLRAPVAYPLQKRPSCGRRHSRTPNDTSRSGARPRSDRPSPGTG